MIMTRPTLWELFSAWLVMGIQSFGGGSSTLILIHEACQKRGWLDDDEFVRLWALVQIAPGINLIKFTLLIGKKLRGWPGLIAASAGLLLPSALVTVLMTAGFTAVQGQPLVQAAMRGVLPAAIGLSLAMGVQMAQPLLTRAYREGPPRLAAHVVIVAAAALLMAVNGVSPVVVMLGAGVCGVLLMALIPARRIPPLTDGDEPPLRRGSLPPGGDSV
jgi:chromate transporter